MKCDRCSKETAVFTMSMFNRDNICMDCKTEETQHPRYKEACAAERKAIEAGNYNFPGIGWKPEE